MLTESAAQMPTTHSVPPFLHIEAAAVGVSTAPATSNTTSHPRPPVLFFTAALASSRGHCRTSSAP